MLSTFFVQLNVITFYLFSTINNGRCQKAALQKSRLAQSTILSKIFSASLSPLLTEEWELVQNNS